ncbi:hypothetical protein DL93DRAFT_2229335 [Clavulina sp. PMI_390]|nr:hypothetical protein DL93DRAFT_2229335 [Clavulina sp. PMI_390]
MPLENESVADDWSSDEEDAQEPVKGPVPPGQIKDKLLKIFQTEFKFEGSYSYNNSFPAAPNPNIEVPGFGLLGLPLNPREAKVLIKHCTQAPFGKGERTVVDKKVRDTWELSPERFTFKNPQFPTWIESTVVPAVAAALGVNGKIVVAEVYKLLVYEKGSHFLAHQDTEKIPGMFGSIIVTLPSQFEGAAVHLSHNDETKVIDLAAESGLTTSVLAWYSDVFHAVKPVTSGYRLALSYNLAIRPGATQARPSAPDTSSASRELQHLLLSWKQDSSQKAPGKLVWNLEHQYSLIGLRQVSLKGRDAQILNVLGPLAERLQFRVLLANVELYENGEADDSGGWGGGRGWGRRSRYCAYDDYSRDDGHHDMIEVIDSRFSVKNVIGLDGATVELDVDIDVDKEMIPYSLKRYGPSTEQYEGYQGNWAGTLEHWYRKTVLIIYPRANEFAVDNRDPVEYAVERLEHKLQRGWSENDQNSRHITTALHPSPTCSADVLTDALNTLMLCAIESDDAALWVDAIRACGAVADPERLELSNIAPAISQFGFPSVSPIFEEILRDGKQNSARFAILDQLHRTPGPKIKSWGKAQRLLVENQLKPLVVDDVPGLLEIAKRSLGDFESRLLPQIIALKPSHEVVSALSSQMLSSRSKWTAKKDKAKWLTIMSTLISKCVEALPRVSTTNAQQCVDDTLVIVRTYDIMEHAEALAPLAAKLERLLEAPPQEPRTYHYLHSNENDRSKTTLAFVLPLLASIVALQRSSTLVKKDPTAYLPLFSLIRLVLSHSLTDKDVQSHVDTIVSILPLAGGIDVFSTILVPRIAEVARTSSSTLQRLAKALYVARDQFDEDAPKVIDLIHRIVAAVAVNGELALTGAYRYLYGSSPSKPYIQLLEFCLDFGDESVALCQVIAPHIKPHSNTPMIPWFIESFSPFWTELAPALKQRNLLPTIEPFRSVLSDNVYAFSAAIGVKHPPGVPLSTTLQAVGCGCADCAQLRNFLTGTTESWEFKAIKARRMHLESVLFSSGAHKWGLQSRTGNGSPQVLILDKPAAMISASRWKTNVAHLQKIILGLGNAQRIREMLGDRTDVISARAHIAVNHAPIDTSSTSPAAAAGTTSNPAPSNSSRLGKRAAPGSSQPAAKRAKGSVNNI